jgi:hypothetical protein
MMAAPTPLVKRYTKKQMGDACEMLIAAELTLAGIPALKVPDNWPGYDVVAQPEGDAEPLRISVKSRTYKTGANFVGFSVHDPFDWLAIVLLNCGVEQKRRVFLIPAELAHRKARRNAPHTKSANARYWSLVEVPKLFLQFENNFNLLPDGIA